MSETVLDVLMYLFETYSEQDLEVEPEPDQSILREELLHAGFGEPEVDRALDWLDGLTDHQLAARCVGRGRNQAPYRDDAKQALTMGK